MLRNLVTAGVVLIVGCVATYFMVIDSAPPPAEVRGGAEQRGATAAKSVAVPREEAKPAAHVSPEEVQRQKAAAAPPPKPLLKDWEKPALALLLSGEQHGYLEPCGCALVQLGGSRGVTTCCVNSAKSGSGRLPRSTWAVSSNRSSRRGSNRA